MIVADRSGDVTAFRLLETFRQFGEELLLEAGDLQDRRDLHLGVYTQRAAGYQLDYEGSRWGVGAAGFEFDWQEIRSAAAWATSTDNRRAFCDVVGTLGYYASWTSRFEVAK